MTATAVPRPSTPLLLDPIAQLYEPPADAPPEAHKGHIPALDGVRGLAILLVLLTHGVDACLRATGGVEFAVYNVARWGWVGVDLFFVLSGFLITGILVGSRGKDHFLRNFFARRALRIFPLYYAVVFVCLVVLPLVPLARFDWLRELSSQQIWFWLHASNYLKILSPDGPALGWLSTLWSLAVEEHFYLVWPFAVLLLTDRRLLQLCAVLIVGSLALRISLTLNGFTGDYMYRSTLTRLDPILLGSALAILARHGGLRRFVRPALWVVGVGLVAVAAQMFVRNGGHGRDTTAWGMTGQYTVVGLVCAAVLVLVLNADRGDTLNRVFTNRILLDLGKYSYALYILNKPCFHLVKEFFAPADHLVYGSQLPATALFVATGCVLTYLAARVTWATVEGPSLALKKYFAA